MSNFANPELTNNFRQIVLASNTPASPAIVFANDLTHGLYWDLTGLHLTGLSSTPSDNTEAASKAYVDAQAGGGGANTALSNLMSVGLVNLGPSAILDFSGDTTTGELSFASLSGNSTWTLGTAGNSPNVIFSTTSNTQPVTIAYDSNFNILIGLQDSGGTSVTALSLVSYHAELDLNDSNISIDLKTSGQLSAQIDHSTTAHDTRLLLWDVDKAVLSRVSVGAADSGGTGFKLLRVPN